MKNAVGIDLKRLIYIMWVRKKVIGGIIAGCMAVAVVALFVVPKQYESTTLVKTRNVGISIDEVTTKLIASGRNEEGIHIDLSSAAYVELMKSRAVCAEAERIIRSKTNTDAAISGYHVKNTRMTNLISVTGGGRTPEEAQLVSQAIVEGFQAVQEKKNQETQDQIIRILDERIEVARQASEDARAQGKADAAEIKQTLYMRLMQQREQHIIQRDMPCMDIQIIDPADLPDKDAVLERKKKLTVLEGFVVGVMLALGYGLFCYKREGNK
ncbi:hypothetical protein FZ041_04370 [Selenomonas caprae]|uniref:Polysaccharide chain length determinant N-terminal domain-containing protein n=1 Tax=Selenomonas caprae TaxID=2606905 RepID=A0A5D6WNX9_9FIRM|nr:Wzz/FepE/Etk N-terminal domain-containing protein [Selenomonas caprae]TYZ29826.1 hypothetical protein FZ041_04370 [Selenomonas caprae]